MKAEDIRTIGLSTSYGTQNVTEKLLREIAAQLAELNEKYERQLKQFDNGSEK